MYSALMLNATQKENTEKHPHWNREGLKGPEDGVRGPEVGHCASERPQCSGTLSFRETTLQRHAVLQCNTLCS